MGYRVVEDYYRREIFEFFRGYRNPFYSVSFELQFSGLKRFLDDRGYKTYLNLCYFFTRAMQPLEDFRYRLLDGEFVLYDAIHPGLTVPAANGLFSFANCDYDPDVDRFNTRAEVPSPEAPSNLRAGNCSDDSIHVFYTAIPGIPFNTFTHATPDTSDAATRVAFGKPYEKQGELWVPVGIQVNHAFVDGRPLGLLYERAVEIFANPEIQE